MCKRLFFLISPVLLFVVSISGSAHADTVVATVQSATVNTDWAATPQDLTALSEDGDWRLWDALGAPEYEKDTSSELIGDLVQVLSFSFYNPGDQNFTWSDGVDPVSTDSTGVGVGSQTVAISLPIGGGYQVDVTLPSGNGNITVWAGTRAGPGRLIVLDGSEEVFSMDGPTRGNVWGLDRFDIEAVGFASNAVLTIQWILSPDSTSTSARINFYGVAIESINAPPTAFNPHPRNNAPAVSIDVGEISWSSNEFVLNQNGTHNVFFGTDEDSVTNATIANAEQLGVTLYQDLARDNNSVDLARLEYNTTYYWRVDEVNAPSHQGTITGVVWSFTTEPEGIALEPEDIIDVTASLNSVYPHEQKPNMTCNESGLDANDMHSNELEGTMWLGSGDNPGEVWIQYEFDKIYKFHQLLVWNYNEKSPSQEFGAKDVNVTYSQDASTWKALDNIVEFQKATGNNNYIANTIVDMDGAMAQYIRLTFLSSWTEDLYTGGISEIRFSVIPTRATVPSPEDGEEDVEVDAVLSWEAGREADVHKVYIGSDPNSVRDGIADIIDETTEASYVPVLGLARTYYWKVDEVNEAEEYTTWDGPVWSFSTVAYIVIDNFEVGYGDTAADAVYKTWKDALELADSLNGSTMGRPSPPYLHTIHHGGGSGHSAPMTYDTLTHTYSEVIAQSVKLPIGTSDWSIGSPTTLTIWFRGDPNTTEVGDSELYCKIGGKTAVFGGSIDTLMRDRWYQWNIDLETLGATLSNIPQITIGVRKVGATGGSGVIWLDDIRLSGQVPATSEEIWIEAEDALTITPIYQILNVLPGASGGQYIGVPEGTGNSTTAPPVTDVNTATYTFIVEEGVYSIEYRMYTEGASGTSDSTWISLPTATAVKVTNGDDAIFTPTGSTIVNGWINTGSMVQGSYWHWDVVHSNSNSNRDIQWTLSAGTHTLKIANREDGFYIDTIVIWKVD